MSQDSDKKVITRFPPSPTGHFHVGSVRTALFNYLFSRKNKGSFILRIEDTDAERSKKEFEKDIFDSLEWLGLEYDNTDIPRQSERKDVYKKYLQQLIDSGHAYISQEETKINSDDQDEKTPEHSKTHKSLRKEVIRFKNPNKTITFFDLVRGEVSIDTSDLKDFVIAKSLEEPLYHLAVVVDDIESGITHVIRGEDHISNTPRQILILEALGADRPIYAHLPLILAPDRSKLSKRKHGEKVSLKFYIDQGFLPEAIINYVALLGWNPGTERELFTLSELVGAFDISKVQKSGAIFNEEKLRWFNKEYMNKLPEGELIHIIHEIFNELTKEKKLKKNFKVEADDVRKLLPILVERSSTFGDIRNMIEQGELDYYFEDPDYAVSNLIWKNKEKSLPKDSKEDLKRRLEHVKTTLQDMDENNFKKDIIKSALWDYATAEGRGEVLWPFRFALSGKEKSPDPFILAELLGKTTTLKRIEGALGKVAHG
jgi:glutamyl-tRNA synthetase